MIQLNYRYTIEEDAETYNGIYLVDLDTRRAGDNKDWDIIEDLLEEQYKGLNASVKVIEVSRD